MGAGTVSADAMSIEVQLVTSLRMVSACMQPLAVVSSSSSEEGGKPARVRDTSTARAASPKYALKHAADMYILQVVSLPSNA